MNNKGSSRTDNISTPKSVDHSDFDLLTEQELANATGRTLVGVRSWRSKREGPAGLKRGKKVFYDKKVVRAWIDEQAKTMNQRLRERPGFRKEA